MFSSPEKNLEQFDVAAPMTVADFGSGSGFYTLLAARKVAGGGRVYSLDIQKELLEQISKDARQEHLTNIDTIWADLEKPNGSKLADMTVDRAFVVNILFQIENKENFVKEISRVLRPQGKVLVIDWTDSFGGLGPEKKSIFSQKAAQELLEKYNFVLEKMVEAGDHHWGMILRKG